MSFKDQIGSLNDALFPGPNKTSPKTLSVFGGESSGFAKGVAELYTKNFYVNKALPDAAGVPNGMADTAIPYSIANKYALFNFQYIMNPKNLNSL